MRWTRRATVIGGTHCPDDWTVSVNGVQVGRVHFAPNYRGAQWAWFTWAHPAESGSAETMSAALERVRERVLASSGVIHKGTPYEARLW